MLLSREVSKVLDSALQTPDILLYAVITPDGKVLDSRETPASTVSAFPYSAGSEDHERVSAKLQTKVYATFAGESWNQLCLSRESTPKWSAFEAHKRRFVVVPVAGTQFLVLAVASASKAYGNIANCAKNISQELQACSPH